MSNTKKLKSLTGSLLREYIEENYDYMGQDTSSRPDGLVNVSESGVVYEYSRAFAGGGEWEGVSEYFGDCLALGYYAPSFFMKSEEDNKPDSIQCDRCKEHIYMAAYNSEGKFKCFSCRANPWR